MIRFRSYDILKYYSTININTMTTIIRSVFKNDCCYYPQIYLDSCSYNYMSEIKKLTIHSTLWAKPIKIVQLDDVILNKLSVKGKYIPKYDLIDYTIKYDGGGF